jgi:TatD DNase family protein
MELFDAHAHLQDERLIGDADGHIRRARAAGVQRAVCCGSSEEDWPAVLELALKYPDFVVASFGLHPWYINGRSPRWLTDLEGFLKKIPSGVGEVGLDFAISDFDPKAQREVFEAQLELARSLGRPVSVHCRKGWEVLFEVMGRTGPLRQGGVLHSYAGGLDRVEEACRHGFSISFSGSITRSNNKKGRKALAAVPGERLLVETDAPDIPPVGVEGITEPCHLALVVRSMAEVLGQAESEVARATFANAQRIFGALKI